MRGTKWQFKKAMQEENTRPGAMFFIPDPTACLITENNSIKPNQMKIFSQKSSPFVKGSSSGIT